MDMMNGTPPSADVNKLKHILSGAKAIMKATESGNFSKGNIDTSKMVSSDNLLESNNMGGVGFNPEPNYKNIENCKLPSAIKEMMLKNPTPQLGGPNHTFNLSDVQDLVTEEKKPNKISSVIPQQQQTNRGDKFMVSESELRALVKDVVKDEIVSFLRDSYAKTISESAIKKTINTLIKEGKIKVKPRV